MSPSTQCRLERGKDVSAVPRKGEHTRSLFYFFFFLCLEYNSLLPAPEKGGTQQALKHKSISRMLSTLTATQVKILTDLAFSLRHDRINARTLQTKY